MDNPFKYGCVVSGDHFCERAKAERELRGFVRAGQNVFVQGERRMGKTSLVRKAVGGLRGERLVYVDLYCIGTQGDLCRRIAEGVGRANATMPFLKRVMSFASRLRPTLSFDSQDGSPKISVDTLAADEPGSLAVVMDLLEKVAADGKTCVVFDEFQDIIRIKDSERILAEMRSRIQFQENVPYLFLGSVRHRMWSIFNDTKSPFFKIPFFKSAAAYDVGEIDVADFSRFIVSRFEKGRRRISLDMAGKIIETVCGVSGDVQELCAALWDVTDANGEVTEDDIPAALDVVFMRERKGFERSVSILTPLQLMVLRGLAASPRARVFGADFLKRVGMANAGAVSKALKRLESHDLVYEVDGEYRFGDSFFRQWILKDGNP